MASAVIRLTSRWGSGDDLDDGRHPVALDPGHDPREPVPRRLADDRAIGGRHPPLSQEPRDLVDRDESLASLGPVDVEATVGLPSPQCLDWTLRASRPRGRPEVGWREERSDRAYVGVSGNAATNV